MTDFLLKSSASLLVFLTFYHLVLEGEKMHRFNRFYLLAALVISFVIPILSFEIIQIILVQAPENIPIVPNFVNVNQTPIVLKTNYIPILLFIIYGLVTAVLVFRFLKNIYKLHLKKQSCPVVKYKNANLVLVDEKVLPHSFLNNIFVNYSEYQNQEIEEELLTHELVHVNQKHTLDILFIELIKTLFWFHPMVYFYKKAIQLNHEFLADEKVVHSYNNVVYYQNLLLQKSSKVETIYLASNLNFLITKKRLIMMTKKTNHKISLLKKLAIVPILVGLISFFCIDVVAQEKVVLNQQLPDQDLNKYYEKTRVIIKDENGKITTDKNYKDLTQEQKRLLPPPPPKLAKKQITKEQFTDFKNKEKFAIWIDGVVSENSKLNNYSPTDFVFFTSSSVFNNARSKQFPQPFQAHLYTKAGFEKEFEKADKSIGGTIELRSPRYEVVTNYDKNNAHSNTITTAENIKMTPATEVAIEKITTDKNGNGIVTSLDQADIGNRKTGYIYMKNSTYFFIKNDDNSVEFYNRWGIRVDNDGEAINKTEQVQGKNVVFNFTAVDQKPEFPDGLAAFLKFVGANYKVSDAISKNTSGGNVFVSFIVERDGSLSNFELLRDFGFGSGEEALRVLKLSPKWQPGKIDGVEVRTSYSLPIKVNSSK